MVSCLSSFPGSYCHWASGGMADALDLGSSVAIRGGSSPPSPTIYVSAERRFSFWGRNFSLDPTWTPVKKNGKAHSSICKTDVTDTSQTRTSPAPDFQYIWSPGGTEPQPSTSVLGTRL